jgi:Na+/proline symporter
VLLVAYATQNGIALPEKPDEIVPLFAAGLLGKAVYFCFIFGIIAATLNSADSALTAIVTSLYVDIFKKGGSAGHTHWRRHLTYLIVCAVFVLIILAFANIGNRSILDTLYIMVGYAYGPLLGLYAFGLLTRRQVYGCAIPYIAIASPVISCLTDAACRHFFHYQFGYELLMLNGMITFLGLLLCYKKDE